MRLTESRGDQTGPDGQATHSHSARASSARAPRSPFALDSVTVSSRVCSPRGWLCQGTPPPRPRAAPSVDEATDTGRLHTIQRPVGSALVSVPEFFFGNFTVDGENEERPPPHFSSLSPTLGEGVRTQLAGAGAWDTRVRACRGGGRGRRKKPARRLAQRAGLKTHLRRHFYQL